MRYLSLFTGIGGFELGIKKAYDAIPRICEHEGGSQENSDIHVNHSELPQGGRQWGSPVCIGYSEIDKYAIEIYKKHFPNHENYGDITKIDERELPDFDLLVGGFPCQSFSIAGKRGGFGDTRGTLFFDIARIVREKQPRLLCLENVKGLLSHDEGRTFATIIGTLDELGYDLEWQVLNSKNHGVPQNRERIFIVGHLRGTGRTKVFPFWESHRGPEETCDPSRKKVANTVRAKLGGPDLENSYFIPIPEATKKGYAEARPGQSINLAVLGSKTRRGRVSDIAQTIDTGMQQHTIAKGGGIRRLTPRECERLQGFPDDWTEGISDTQRYKCIGNAVTVNVIRDIFDRIMK